MDNKSAQIYISLFFLFIGSLLVFSFGFLVGQIDFLGIIQGGDESTPNNQVADKKPIQGDVSGDEVGVDASLLWEAWNKIEQNHINSDELDRQDMLYAAIDGIVDYLDDDYSQYLTPSDTADYEQSSGGQFEGIGAFLRYNGEYTIIDTPIDDYPAQEAGLISGDWILEVNGEDVQGQNSFEVAEAIKGPAGTDVTIKIFRPSTQEEETFEITRRAIDLENIAYEEPSEDIGLIKLYRFNESDTSEFRDQWDNAVDRVLENNSNKVIIDLRNNPGGRVSFVQYVTEEFLEKGDVIMREVDNNGNEDVYRAKRTGRLVDHEVIVLVNAGSASASEIMSGALQDNDRATILGEETLGKGVEQTVQTLSDGSTLLIVFKKWLTPSGDQVTPESAIKPDVEVELTTEDFQNGDDPQLDRALDILNN